MMIQTTETKKQTKLRHELKHQISKAEDLVLVSSLSKLFTRDKNAGPDGSYTITSLYFDTPYDQALLEKVDGVNRREKFRLRYYGEDTSFIRLEKKYKINGLTGKVSERISVEEVEKLLNKDYDFLIDSQKPLFIELYSKIKGKKLEPKTIVTYEREAFSYPSGNVRITLDRNIRSGLWKKDFLNPNGLRLRVFDPFITIAEVKYDEFLPDIVKETIQIPNRFASANSKYAYARRFD